MKSWFEKGKNECKYVRVCEQIREMCSWKDRCDMTLFNKEAQLLIFMYKLNKIKKCCFKCACIVQIKNYKQNARCS